jgi:hypothetical protein
VEVHCLHMRACFGGMVDGEAFCFAEFQRQLDYT